MPETPRGRWDPLSVDGIRAVLARVRVPWWIAGGWAIDLYAGRVTRRHGDIDVGLRRSDHRAVFDALPGWEIHAARDGRLRKLSFRERAAGVPPEDHGFWCRRPAAPGGAVAPWAFELLLDEGAGDEWRFRRDPRIRAPLARALERTSHGVPFLAPELQLLYKAKARRPRDDEDLETALPLMSESRRAWLRESLAMLDPRHAWLDRL